MICPRLLQDPHYPLMAHQNAVQNRAIPNGSSKCAEGKVTRARLHLHCQFLCNERGQGFQSTCKVHRAARNTSTQTKLW
eukprot:scaffold49_cov409-Prasinococcus_capsulatus_cf.AAC.26